MPGAKQLAQKISYWGDFTAWMAQSHPEVVNLRDVRRSHAEEYIALLRTSGSFQYVESQRRRMEETKCSSGKTVEFVPQGLSPATINVRHKTVKAVFAWLAADAGIIENPFDIQFLDNQYESGEAFTPEELRLIGAHLDDDPFVKPIFLIGICTGLSEGDICNLRWEEIRNGWIVRKRRKTGAALDIPILPPLAAFLAEHRPIENSEFVLPEHAAMYAFESDRRSLIGSSSFWSVSELRLQGKRRGAAVRSVRKTFTVSATLSPIWPESIVFRCRSCSRCWDT